MAKAVNTGHRTRKSTTMVTVAVPVAPPLDCQTVSAFPLPYDDCVNVTLSFIPVFMIAIDLGNLESLLFNYYNKQ